jgi:hypothetical protein
MFSFEGKAFWADTSRGLAYCDLRAAGRNPAVEFDFIGLQYGYEIPFADLPEDELTEMNRTTGCAGGRVKFICWYNNYYLFRIRLICHKLGYVKILGNVPLILSFGNSNNRYQEQS